MTKKEIVRKHANGWVGGMTGGDEERIVYPSMDEYAKQEAIDFAKYVDDEGYTQLLDEDKWGSFNRELNTEQLYELYLKSKK